MWCAIYWGRCGDTSGLQSALGQSYRVCVFIWQPAGRRTGRQLIIYHNYKAPINPDIDSAIDPDQRVGGRGARGGGWQKSTVILKLDAHFTC